MGNQYTISQLAKAAGVPTTTMRYYERIGLVKPEDRSQGNYRLYGDESLRKVVFIRTAQSIGFTLDDVKALLATPDSTAASCREVQTLIEERPAEVSQRLKDLRQVQRVLKSSLAWEQTVCFQAGRESRQSAFGTPSGGIEAEKTTRMRELVWARRGDEAGGGGVGRANRDVMRPLGRGITRPARKANAKTRACFLLETRLTGASRRSRYLKIRRLAVAPFRQRTSMRSAALAIDASGPTT